MVAVAMRVFVRKTRSKPNYRCVIGRWQACRGGRYFQLRAQLVDFGLDIAQFGIERYLAIELFFLVQTSFQLVVLVLLATQPGQLVGQAFVRTGAGLFLTGD